MTPLLLTIITITKNDPRGLARTLASMEKWRDEAWVEQVLVDASTAPTVMADSRVRVLRQISTGISGAFNEGLAEARGEWIWFVNGGDAIHENLNPDWLRCWLEVTAADIATGGVHYDGEALARAHPAISEQSLMLRSWLPHPSTLVRRARLVDAGAFDPTWKIAMDYDLWFRLLKRRPVVDVISVPLARFDRGGMSSSPSFASLLEGENAQLIWREKAVALSEWLRRGGRFLLIILHAFRAK